MNRAQLAYFFERVGSAMKEEKRDFKDIEYYNLVMLDIITTIFYNYVQEKDRFLDNILAIHNSIKDHAMKKETKKHPDVKEDKKLVKKMVKKDCMK